MQKEMNFNDVGIFSIKRSDYKIHFWHINKDDAISIMNNSDINEKKDYYKLFLLHIKMGEENYY